MTALLASFWAWCLAHPLEAIGLAVYVLLNLVNKLSRYPRAKGVVHVLRVIVDLVSVLPHRDSPGLFTLPGRRSRPPRGYANLPILVLLAVLAAIAVTGCASWSRSSSETHATVTAQVDQHVEDHGTERTAEHVVTRRSGGAVDVKEYFPDGKLKREMHRAPVEQLQDAQKHADVQKALTDDAKALLGAETDDKKSDAGGAKPDLGCGFSGFLWIALICFAGAGLAYFRREALGALFKRVIAKIIP